MGHFISGRVFPGPATPSVNSCRSWRRRHAKLLLIAALERSYAGKAAVQGNGLNGMSRKNAQLHMGYLNPGAFQILPWCEAMLHLKIPDDAARADTADICQRFQGERFGEVCEQILLRPAELDGGWRRRGPLFGEDFLAEADQHSQTDIVKKAGDQVRQELRLGAIKRYCEVDD